MVIARPWAITKLVLQDDGSYRFTAVILKSTGQTYIHGCRYMAATSKRIYMPSVRLGTNYIPQVTNSKNDTACLRKLVARAITEQVKAERVRADREAINADIATAPSQEFGASSVDVQPID